MTAPVESVREFLERLARIGNYQAMIAAIKARDAAIRADALAEARAGVAAMEKVVVKFREAMCSLPNGRYDLIREYAQVIGEALAALPPPPEDTP